MTKKIYASLPGLTTHSFRLSHVAFSPEEMERRLAPVVKLPLDLELQLLRDLVDPEKTPLVSQKTREAANILLANRELT
jgi:hypothetical protein